MSFFKISDARKCIYFRGETFQIVVRFKERMEVKENKKYIAAMYSLNVESDKLSICHEWKRREERKFSLQCENTYVLVDLLDDDDV